MFNLILIIITIGGIIWLQVAMKMNNESSKRNEKKKLEDYIAAESEANYARKKEIPLELIVKPDTKALPVRQYPKEDKYRRINAIQERVLNAAGAYMLKFNKPMTNREIKLAFGIANFERVAKAEEAYQAYIRRLIEWAEYLKSQGELNDSKIILEESIRLGSDISKGFLMLAEIYFAQNDLSSLTELKTRLESTEANPYNNEVSEKVVARINELINNLLEDEK